MTTANQSNEKIGVGALAPDFELTDQQGQTVRLSDFRGRQAVVLIFYPADQTPGCTKQLCTARDDAEVYYQTGAVVFGVNPGNEISHRKFIDKFNLSMPLLVDKGLKVATRYNAVIGFGPLKIVNRTVVVVGKDGKIVFYRRGMPGTAEILAAVPR